MPRLGIGIGLPRIARGGVVATNEIFPSSFSQSSTAAGVTSATTANMADGDQTTGTGTGVSTAEFIRADLGSAQLVSTVRVAGGLLHVFGGTASSLNGFVIQSSTDDINWTTQATISGVSDVGGPVDFSFTAVTARYWRISNGGASSAVATTEFRFYYFPPVVLNNGWFFDTPDASGHLLTSGII